MGFNDMMTGLGGRGMWALYLGVAALWMAVVAVLLIALRAPRIEAADVEAPPPPESALDVLDPRATRPAFYTSPSHPSSILPS